MQITGTYFFNEATRVSTNYVNSGNTPYRIYFFTVDQFLDGALINNVYADVNDSGVLDSQDISSGYLGQIATYSLNLQLPVTGIFGSWVYDLSLGKIETFDASGPQIGVSYPYSLSSGASLFGALNFEEVSPRILYDDSAQELLGQFDINISMLGGDDFLEVVGGEDNFANGNNGADEIQVKGGFGRYLGGADNDNLTVFDAVTGTKVNGNRGEDFVSGSAEGVVFRGGSENDVLEVGQGIVWGDLGSDVFTAIGGNGYARVNDYESGVDFVQLTTSGSWRLFEEGLMFSDSTGDDQMLLIGLNSTDQISFI